MPARMKEPSQQDIQDYLFSLNRSENAAIVSIDTQRLKATAIANTRLWFKQHGIAIHQDERTHVWKLGHAPKEDIPQQQEPPDNEQASEEPSIHQNEAR